MMKGFADFMLELIQVIARVVGAIASTGLFVLRLIERKEHKKATAQSKVKVAFFITY